MIDNSKFISSSFTFNELDKILSSFLVLDETTEPLMTEMDVIYINKKLLKND